MTNSRVQFNYLGLDSRITISRKGIIKTEIFYFEIKTFFLAFSRKNETVGDELSREIKLTAVHSNIVIRKGLFNI